MYLIAAIVCLVEIIDDNVSKNHCVTNCSSTKTVASSNLSQHILTRIVCKIENLTFLFLGNLACSAKNRAQVFVVGTQLTQHMTILYGL